MTFKSRQKQILLNIFICFFIFLLSFKVFTLTNRPFDTTDSFPNNLTAFSVLFYHRLDLTPLVKIMHQRGIGKMAIPSEKGIYFSKTPPLIGLLSIPTLAVLNRWYGVKYLTPEQLIYSDYGQIVGKLSGAFYCSLSGVVLYLFLRKLTKKQILSLFLTSVYLFADNVFNTASQANWQHGISLFLIVVFLYLAVFQSKFRLSIFASGFLLGLLTQIRISNGFYVLFPLLWLWEIEKARKGFIKKVLIFLGGLSIGYLPVTFFYLHFHIPYGYGNEILDSIKELSLRSAFVSLQDVLLSFNNGFFAFSPVFLLSFIGAVQFLKKDRTDIFYKVTRKLIPVLGLFLIFLSVWKYYLGGTSLNARYLLESLPIWVLLLGIFMEKFGQFWLGKILVAGLLTISVLLNVLTVYFMDWLWFPYYTFGTAKSQHHDAWYHSPTLIGYLVQRRVIHLENMFQRGNKIYIWRAEYRILSNGKVFLPFKQEEYVSLNLK